MRALKQNCPGAVKANQQKMDVANEFARDLNRSFRGTPRNLVRPFGVPRGDNANNIANAGGRAVNDAAPNPEVAKIAEKNRVL